MKTVKEITQHLKEGNVLVNNGNRLQYNEPTMGYIVNGVKTISIFYALRLFIKN